MDLNPDYSLIIQVVTFLVLWACLKRLVFDPMSQVLDDRHQRTVGTRAVAESMLAGVQSARDEHANTVQAVRHEIAQQAEASRKAAHAAHNQALAEARGEAAAEQERQRAALQEQLANARRALDAEA
ncbi:MAG: hypothetical protein A3J75_06225, partial [Acidobacteria bacterium RBG_16_68_9]